MFGVFEVQYFNVRSKTTWGKEQMVMVNPLHFMFDQVIKTLQYYLLRKKGYPDLKKPTKNRKLHGKRFYADHQSSLSLAIENCMV